MLEMFLGALIMFVGVVLGAGLTSVAYKNRDEPPYS